MRIDFAKLQHQYRLYKSEIDAAIARVFEHGRFIMGPEVAQLEAGLCAFTGAKEAVGCASGTDALLLALMALGVGRGDEVITTPFTFIATAEAIALLGAAPVFADIDESTYNIDPAKIEEKITDKTRGIISVSLYGQPSDLDAINSIAKRHGIFHIVDGAQSFGATYKEKAEVHHCDIYTTSFFPAKPLGCFGDGGAVLTNDEELAKKMRMLRIHGQDRRYHHRYIGLNARLDTIQAAVLLVKLSHYQKDLALRQEVARKYHAALPDGIIKPSVPADRTSAWAQYSIRVRERERLQKKLKDAGIPTAVHYPMPLHLQECFQDLGYKKGEFPIAEKISTQILSLPMNPYLKDEEIKYITKKVAQFV